MHFFILALQAAACLFIASFGLFTLNKMSKSTQPLILFAYAALTAGGFAGLVGCFISYDVLYCLFAVGVALFLVANQRGGRLTA